MLVLLPRRLSSPPSFHTRWHLSRQRQELFVHVRARGKEATDGWEPGSRCLANGFLKHDPTAPRLPTAAWMDIVLLLHECIMVWDSAGGAPSAVREHMYLQKVGYTNWLGSPACKRCCNSAKHAAFSMRSNDPRWSKAPRIEIEGGWVYKFITTFWLNGMPIQAIFHRRITKNDHGAEHEWPDWIPLVGPFVNATWDCWKIQPGRYPPNIANRQTWENEATHIGCPGFNLDDRPQSKLRK